MQVICWSVFALLGLLQVALRPLQLSEPAVWFGGFQLLLGCGLAAMGWRTMRALERGDTIVQ